MNSQRNASAVNHLLQIEVRGRQQAQSQRELLLPPHPFEGSILENRK